MPTRTTAAFTTGESPAAAKMNADAKGWVASETMTSTTSAITTETTLALPTTSGTSVPLLANRRYLILVYLQFTSASSTAVARVRIKEDGTVVGMGGISVPTTTGYEVSLTVQTQVTTTADVTKTYTVTVERVDGSGTLVCNGALSGSPNRIQIIDIGPSS